MLLTFVAIQVIFLLALLLGWTLAPKKPPVITVDVTFKPAGVASAPTEPPAPMPEEILEYIEQESEDHARQFRKNRARALFNEFNDWAIVFRALQREDDINADPTP